MMPASPSWRARICGELRVQIAAAQHAVGRGSADRTSRPGPAGPAAAAPATMSRRTRSVAVAVNACSDDAGKIVAQPSELAVLGTEIVSPLADAVRLVDGDEPDAGLREHAAAAAGSPRRPGARARRTAAGSDPRARSRAPRRARRGSSVLFKYAAGDAVDAQAVDLILHQRDQRRHHDASRDAHRRRSRTAPDAAVGASPLGRMRRSPAPENTATCRRRSAGRRRCRARRESRASPRAAADGNRRSPRRGGARRRAGGQRRA